MKRNKTPDKRTLLLLITALVIIVLVAVILYFVVLPKLNIDINGTTNNGSDISQDSIPSSDEKGQENQTNGNKGDVQENQTNGNIDEDNIKIHFVFVGQGDAIVIELPENKYMVIDAGSGNSASSATKNRYYTYLDNVVEGSVIDYLIVTHPDSDHVNMMTKVVEDYEIKNLYYNDYYAQGSKTYKTFMDTAAAEEGATLNVISTPDDSTYTITVGKCSIVLFSPGNDGFTSETAKIKNGMSIMALLTYGDRKILLTGDANEEEEAWFIAYTMEYDMDVDFLKVGHHGSSGSSTNEFLAYVKAEYAIICVDEDNNTYGHPTQSALDRLTAANAEIYRTDLNGSIILTIDCDGDYEFNFVENK